LICTSRSSVNTSSDLMNRGHRQSRDIAFNAAIAWLIFGDPTGHSPTVHSLCERASRYPSRFSSTVSCTRLRYPNGSAATTAISAGGSIFPSRCRASTRIARLATSWYAYGAC
jgi:hypothetical protein